MHPVTQGARLLTDWAHQLHQAGVPSRLTLNADGSVLIRTAGPRQAREVLGLRLPDDVCAGVRFTVRPL